MKQICLLNIKHFCLDFIEVYLKTNLEIPCYDYTMVCKDDKIFLCRLFIISNNIFIRVCHDNVRVMENIKKCQCKRLAKVSFAPFENRTAFSHNSYQHHHHHHDNRHRHSDTHHHYPDQCLRPGLTTSAKERLEGSLVSKSWSTEG